MPYSGGDRRFMESEPVVRLILRFALPAVAGMVAGAIYNIVDRIFVGRYVGPAGLAAVSVSFPSMLVMSAFTMLICTGGASRVSILLGAKKRREAEQVLASTLVMLAAVSAAFILLSFSSVEGMLKLSGADGEILAVAYDYLKILLRCAPLGLFGFASNFLVKASGSPKYAMFSQIVGACSNVALDALFIVSFGMGVAGAAYGTAISQGISAAMGLAYFLRRGASPRIRARFLTLPRAEVVRRIFAVGSAPFFMEFSFVLFMTIMNNLVVRYGGNDGLSAMGIFFGIDSLLFLPAIAIGEASQPIIGYNYGAARPARVVKAIKCALVMTVGLYLLSLFLAEAFAGEMMRLFTEDEGILAVGVPGMRIGYMAIPFMGITVVTNSALQGLGKGGHSLALSFCRHVLCMFLPLLILPRFFGMTGIWASYPVGDFGGGLISACFMVWVLRWLRSPEALSVK